MLRVATSSTDHVDFDFASPLLRLAIENATLNIGDYVYVSGGLAFTKQSNMTLKLSDANHATSTCGSIRLRRREP